MQELPSKVMGHKREKEFHMQVRRDPLGTLLRENGMLENGTHYGTVVVKWVQRAIGKGGKHTVMTPNTWVFHQSIKMGELSLTTKPCLQIEVHFTRMVDETVGHLMISLFSSSSG